MNTARSGHDSLWTQTHQPSNIKRGGSVPFPISPNYSSGKPPFGSFTSYMNCVRGGSKFTIGRVVGWHVTFLSRLTAIFFYVYLTTEGLKFWTGLSISIKNLSPDQMCSDVSLAEIITDQWWPYARLQPVYFFLLTLIFFWGGKRYLLK